MAPCLLPTWGASSKTWTRPPGGRSLEPGSWNRIIIESGGSKGSARPVISGIGGKLARVEDPSSNITTTMEGASLGRWSVLEYSTGAPAMIARLMGLKTISPVHLHQLIQDGGATIVDVNSRDSWTTARVPGAQHLDHASYTERDLPEDRGAALVFYCSGPLCRKAPLAARRAEKLGYRDVRVLSAGISGWLSANLPTEHGERSTA